ncbi:hypothetical protein [Sideroxyarcus sp. TK5]
MLNRLLSMFVLLCLGSLSIPASNADGWQLAPQTSNAAGVKVTVTPQAPTGNDTAWGFEVMLETHIHPLDEDLTRSAILLVDGQTLRPSKWEGAAPGGHHRKGLLSFGPLAAKFDSLELRIQLNGEATPRSFLWSQEGVLHGN